MTRAALRLALAAWVRLPRELAIANAAFFLAVMLPLPLLRLLPGGWLLGGLLLWGAWSWCGFSALVAACMRLNDGVSQPWARTREWWRAQWAERLAALAATSLGLAWSVAAALFWLRNPSLGWLAWPLLGVCGALALWLALAALLSLGLAADGGRGLRELWRTCALLPLAFLPSALGAGGVFLLLSGAPVLIRGPRHWSAPLLMAPLLMGAMFTAAFAALFIGLLTRAMIDRAQGKSAPPLPGWRELWNPWR